MTIIDFSDSHSLMNQYLLEVREVSLQQDSMRFRRNLERIGEIMAYEISKTLVYSSKEVTTPLGTSRVDTIDDSIVLSTVLRAGLPFHQGFLNYFDQAENAFVSAYRKYEDLHSFDVQVEYIASPTLEGKTLILVDPMLATGLSLELAYKALLSRGKPAHVHVASIIASRQGINYLSKQMPEIDMLWCGAIDPDLDAHSYIVPGLGDAGDLAFGEKL
jgi:uracil phosphoribosyltransferase